MFVHLLRSIGRRATYANVMATIAVFVALGGTSYAAIVVTGANVRDGSITGQDIADASVPGAKLTPGTIRGLQIKNGSLGVAELSPSAREALTGATGSRGSDGAAGTNGTNGSNGAAGGQGIQGIPGTPGIQGIQGVPGTPGALGITRVLSSSVPVDTLATNFIAVATCPVDTVVVGGGPRITLTDEPGELVVVQSYPRDSAAWRVAVAPNTGTLDGDENFSAYALCAPGTFADAV